MKTLKTYILRTNETPTGCWIDKTEATSIIAARKIFDSRNCGKFQIEEYGNTDYYTIPEGRNVRL